MLTGALNMDPTFYNLYISILRYAAPILAAIVLFRCIWPLISFRREPEIWGWLCLPDGVKLPITHWENVIGRSKRSDIVVDFPTVVIFLAVALGSIFLPVSPVIFVLAAAVAGILLKALGGKKA